MLGAEADLKKVGDRVVKTFYNDCCWEPLRVRPAKTTDQLAAQARLVQSLDFAFFPKILDHYPTRCPKGEPTYVWELEWIEGETFKTYLERYQASGKKRPSPDPLQYLDRLVEAVEELHAHGYYHNDLHWENLILAPSGDVKLIDLASLGPPVDHQVKMESFSVEVLTDGFREMAGMPKLYNKWARKMVDPRLETFG